MKATDIRPGMRVRVPNWQNSGAYSVRTVLQVNTEPQYIRLTFERIPGQPSGLWLSLTETLEAEHIPYPLKAQAEQVLRAITTDDSYHAVQDILKSEGIIP